MEHFDNLLVNAALLIIMGFFYTRITRFFRKSSIQQQLLNGVMFGTISVAVMHFPAYFMPGLIFDTRTIMISISGFFCGPISAAVSVLMASAFRIQQAGIGVLPGVCTIIASGVLGTIYYFLRKKYPSATKSVYIYIFGLIVHVVMLLCMFILPREIALKVLNDITLPVIIIYPVASFIIIGFLLDKKARIDSEEDLVEREKHYYELLSNLSTGILIYSPDKKLIFCNSRASSMLGRKTLELEGRSMDELRGIFNNIYKDYFVLEDGSTMQPEQHPVNIVLETQQPLTEYIVGLNRKSTDFIWTVVNAFPEFDTKGELSQVVVTFTDITRSKQVLENLKESEEKLRITLNSIGDGVIATDTNARITRMNPEAERLTGWKIAEAAGKPLEKVFDIINSQTLKPVESPVEKVLLTGNVVGLANHTMLRSKNGKEYQIADSGAPMRDNDGNITGVILVFRDVTEDYRSHEKIRRNESLLNHVGELAKVGGWRLELESGKVVWTKAVYDIMETPYDQPAPVFDKYHSIFTPEFSNLVWDNINRHVKENMPLDFEAKIETAKGNIKWCRIIGEKYTQDGKCIGIHGAFQDISAAKKAEDNILNISKFPDENPFPVLRSDRDGKLLYANKSSNNLLESWKVERGHLLPPVWRERIKKAHIHKEIEEYEVSYSGVTLLMAVTPIANTEYVNIYGFDISERKKNVEELNRIKILLDEIQTVAGVGGWEVDFEKETHIWTRENYRIHDTSPDEYTPTIESAIDFYTPDSRPIIQKAVENAKKYGTPFDLELDITTAKGRKVAIHTSSKIIRKNGQTVRMLGAFQDISERKEKEIELKEALARAEEASRAKNQFLATMSHEIRTPLNGIMGFSEILENALHQLECPERKKLIEYLDIVVTCGKNVNDLINDILELASLEAGKNNVKMEKFSPSKIIQESINIFNFKAVKKNIDLKFEFKLLPTTVRGAKRQFRQVVFNILGNAVKFTNKGEVLVKADYRNGALIIDVQDTGIGIPEDMKEKILEPFTQVDQSSTRKYSGTGLGLTIVSKILESIGGMMKIKSKLNEGSTISFIFPAEASKEFKMKKELSHMHTEDDSPARILAVEDNEISVLYLKEILEGTGMDFKIAESFTRMSEICNQGFIPDLVLMDISLPDADGVECAKWLREKFPDKDIKCIAQTAHVMDDEIEDYKGENFDDFIAKPYKKEDLLDIIDRNL